MASTTRTRWQAVAGVVALWPLAHAMWTQPEASLRGTVMQGTGSRGE
jgi:hypothetical protein